MRAFVACVLIAAVAAQPPLPTTTEKPRFFHALGQSLENTAHAVGDELKDFVSTQGDHLLHEVLPSVLGQALAGGISSLFHHGDTTAAPGKRQIDQLQHLMQTVEQELHVAEAFAADLGVDIRHLVENLMTGQLTSDQYLDSLPPLTERAHRLLSNFRTHVQHELQSLQGHKRQLDVLGTVSGLVQGLETQGQALFGQVTDALKALTNPQNLLTLAGQLAQRVAN